ncbi:MAG: molybdate ABC transporter substrate-binding protein [Burkholderiaceae bacterium]|nr:molybdate ABC transporter substrate-binding protein [Burkholderiaceae bacterium]MDH3459731.1 molybdate ABC transporter substrate-binding protein [Burkholderiaceae bacterium]
MLTGVTQAAEVSVAVAANFATPMKKLAIEFEKATGHKMQVSLGSTGKFYAQIKHGAAFEALLAADEKTPARLEQEGLAVKGSRFTYAIGKLVLWSQRTNLVDSKGTVLHTGTFEQLALADPKVSPYGNAAVQTLTRLARLEQLRGRLIFGEGIAQVYQFVATGNASLGFVALSQVMTDGRIEQGSFWLVPTDLYDPIRQGAVLLKAGQNKPAAVAFLTFLQSNKACELIRAYGYSFDGHVWK